LDMWGVMHDGKTPYPGALETVSRLCDANKKMVILSNSSKRVGNAVRMLEKLGFDPDDFVEVITSGEVSHRMLSGDATLGCEVWEVLTNLINGKGGKGSGEKKAFVFGSGDGDVEYCKTAGWTVSSVQDADLIIARGTFTIDCGDPDAVVSKLRDGEEAYFAALDEALKAAAKRGVPMLVTNPDRVRPDEGLPPMPGAIGDAYERALLSAGSIETAEEAPELVRRIGKPHPEVYQLAFSALAAGEEGKGGKEANNAATTTLMVGDALETDVAGGADAGCSTLWVVETGIHGPDAREISGGEEGDDNAMGRGAEEVLARFNKRKGTGLSPTFVTSGFQW